jgi:hypothetical protein
MAIRKTLKPEILQKCKDSQQVINRLAYEYVKHSNTIKRWLEVESVELTRSETLNYISEELNIKKSELCQ